MYQICYFLGAFSATALALALPGIDLLFCGFCVYIVALYQELYRKLEILDANDDNIEKKVDEKIRTKTIIDCVYFHDDVLRYAICYAV